MTRTRKSKWSDEYGRHDRHTRKFGPLTVVVHGENLYREDATSYVRAYVQEFEVKADLDIPASMIPVKWWEDEFWPTACKMIEKLVKKMIREWAK